MTTKTILKDDGIFVYDDYKQGRAALRIKELNSTNPAQYIRRTSTGNIKAVLVSADWLEAQLASNAAFKQNYQVVSDDFLGSNLSKMVDLIQGHAQTKALVKTVAETGITLDAYLSYKVINSAEYFSDQSPIIPYEESAKKKGEVVAYMIHPDIYGVLASAVAPITYLGTGDGTMTASLVPSGAVTEIITATATDPVTFAVAGSVSGALGNATVGTLFTSAVVELLITDGSVAFVAGDAFTVTVTL